MSKSRGAVITLFSFVMVFAALFATHIAANATTPIDPHKHLYIEANGSYSYYTLNKETYIEGTLPNEWIASWGKDALQAGAVIIRSGVYWRVNRSVLSTPWRNNNCYEDPSGQKLFYRTTPTSRNGQEEWHPGSYHYNTTAATSATIESHAEWLTQPADQPDKFVPLRYNSTIQNATNSGIGDWIQRIRYAYVTQTPGDPYNPNRECSQFPKNQTSSDPTYNITDPLFESAWRGNWGWSRIVAIDAGSVIQWASAPGWTGPITIGRSPGSGDMQSEVNYRVGDNLVQGVWRSNQGWTRNIPIANGVIQWTSAPAWSGPISINGLPGSGDMQAHGDYAVGATLIQAVWRSNQGWSRNVPIVNGVVQWGQAGAWGGPISISGLPGSGDMQAQDNYVIGNTYWQIIWRNNNQWTRSVPIVNGVVQFPQAGSWSNTTSQENLPGSGNVQAQGNYVFP